jgi:hypothetical protein
VVALLLLGHLLSFLDQNAILNLLHSLV